MVFFAVVGFLTMSAYPNWGAPTRKELERVVVCAKNIAIGERVGEDMIQEISISERLPDSATQTAQVAGMFSGKNYRAGEIIDRTFLHDKPQKVFVSAYRSTIEIQQGEEFSLSKVTLDRVPLIKLPAHYISDCSQFNSKVAARRIDAKTFFAIDDVK